MRKKGYDYSLEVRTDGSYVKFSLEKIIEKKSTNKKKKDKNKKSQFFAKDSEISAAAGVSINTPISGNFVEILIFFDIKSFLTLFIKFFVSVNSETFETIGNIIFTFP